MKIYLGIDLDSSHYPPIAPEGEGLIGVDAMNPSKFLDYLELRLGYSGFYEEESTRVEEYRVLLKNYILKNPNAFFKSSFEKDPLAVAKHLLSLRDELYLHGLVFSLSSSPVGRLIQLIEIEMNSRISAGKGERFRSILQDINRISDEIEIVLIDPIEHFPRYFQNLLRNFKQIQTFCAKKTSSPHDLSLFKKALAGEKVTETLIGDESLNIYFYKNEYALSRAFPQILKNNPASVIYSPTETHLLDESLAMSGLPTLGSKLESSQRPLLELIKLIPIFLFNPIDPQKLMEFFLIPDGPINKRLSMNLVKALSASPGVGGPAWENGIKESTYGDIKQNLKQSLDELSFYLSQEKVLHEESVEISNLVELYSHLKDYYQKKITAENQSYKAAFVLLGTLIAFLEIRGRSEPTISKIELEVLLKNFLPTREILHASSQISTYQKITHISSLYDTVSTFVWVGLSEERGAAKSSFWDNNELLFLKSVGVDIQSDAEKKNFALEREISSLLKVKDKVIFFIKEESGDTSTHPIYQILDTYFEEVKDKITGEVTHPNIKKIIKDINYYQTETIAERLIPKRLESVTLNDLKSIAKEKHSYSSLYDLFYKPFEWVLKKGADFYESSLASIQTDNNLYGNLSHRVFELFFSSHTDLKNISKENVKSWFDSVIDDLLRKEGSNLLLTENKRSLITFKTLTLSGLSTLTSILQKDKWEIVATEKELQGILFGEKVESKIDLIVKRGNEIAVIDYKWSGYSRKLSEIADGADLQLAIYSKLATENDDFAHTAYFIINESKLIAKDKKAFSNALSPQTADDSQLSYPDLIDLMEATFKYRMDELKAGCLDLSNSDKDNAKIFEEKGLVPYPKKIYLNSAFLTFLGWEPGHD